MSDPRTVFIKRFPAKGHVPKKHGWYHCMINKNVMTVLAFGKTEHTFGNGWHGIGKQEDLVYFLEEEIPLSSLLPEIRMPSEEQIEEDGKEGGLRDNELQMFCEGGEAVKRLFKSLNPHLFPQPNNKG